MPPIFMPPTLFNRSLHRLALVSPVSSEKVCRFRPLHTAAYPRTILRQVLPALSSQEP